MKVSGLAATVKILHSEFANDRLEINTLAGRDNVDSSGLAAGAIQLFVDGLPVPQSNLARQGHAGPRPGATALAR